MHGESATRRRGCLRRAGWWVRSRPRASGRPRWATQVEREARTAAGRAVQAHRTAHALHAAPHDAETYAGARIGLGALQPFEHAKDPLLVLARDTAAIVGNREPDARAMSL